jgi:peroxiredoxin
LLQAKIIEDSELVHSNAIPVLINIIFYRYTLPEVQEYIKTANYLTGISNKSTKGKILLYKTLIKIFLDANLEYAHTLAQKMRDEFLDNTEVQIFLASLPKREYTIGDVAPDINLPDTSGKYLALSNLKGRIVLLDFWASWCAPCRLENPNLVSAYQKFKDKGFTVYSVSLDNSKEKWKSAIIKDNLTWYHVSDLMGWQSAAAKMYGVKGIPQTYLLDKNGKIIAKNLRGQELHVTLEKLFSSE